MIIKASCQMLKAKSSLKGNFHFIDTDHQRINSFNSQ